jgi:hypothetical protein
VDVLSRLGVAENADRQVEYPRTMFADQLFERLFGHLLTFRRRPMIVSVYIEQINHLSFTEKLNIFWEKRRNGHPRHGREDAAMPPNAVNLSIMFSPKAKFIAPGGMQRRELKAYLEYKGLI